MNPLRRLTQLVQARARSAPSVPAEPILTPSRIEPCHHPSGFILEAVAYGDGPDAPPRLATVACPTCRQTWTFDHLRDPWIDGYKAWLDGKGGTGVHEREAQR